VVTHVSRNLDPRDVTGHLGIPTTTGTRTVWDLATVLSPTGLRRAFEQAEKLRILDRERLRALLAASPSRKGAGLIRRLLAEAALPLEETRSRLEELILELCRDEGLPLPAVNVPLLGWEVDSPGSGSGSSSKPTAATISAAGSATATTSATWRSGGPAFSSVATGGCRSTSAGR
jgi:hypothetical protein